VDKFDTDLNPHRFAASSQSARWSGAHSYTDLHPSREETRHLTYMTQLARAGSHVLLSALCNALASAQITPNTEPLVVLVARFGSWLPN
jgi:hypothetical protein